MTEIDYKNSYGLQIVKPFDLWNKNIKGQGIKIAVIDTGCDVKNPLIKENIIGGKNFTEDDNSREDVYNDYNGHGTHVAGIIKSVAPEAELLILKVLDRNGNGDYNTITAAINYAVSCGVDIISMSLGGGSDNRPLYNSVINAINNNILVVCAAGNNGDGNGDTEEYSYPGAYHEVIQVGAIDENYAATDFSNSNKFVDIVAPGKDVVSLGLKNDFVKLSGTSQATPFVTGALALIKQYYEQDFGRKLYEDELYAQLIKNTNRIEGLSRTFQGNGVIDLSGIFNK